MRLPIWSSLASIGNAIAQSVSTWPGDRLRKIAVCVLLTTQAGLLAYSATRHSPTHLEPAFLASGISHWQFGRFELYRVNPPLVRMVAALPVLAVDCKTDWSRFYDGPGSRAEFPVGEDFIEANGPASISLFYYARWACIPFNLIGAYFAYCWAMELYRSVAAGFMTLVLYIFEPNLLAHGELITPDGACTAFGILAGYTFWRWLKQPTWVRAILAGASLGIAELSKTSWLILFGLWPLLWGLWRWMESPTITDRQSDSIDSPESTPRVSTAPPRSALVKTGVVPSQCFLGHSHSSFFQLAGILLIAIYIINLCYLFDGFGTPLKDFQFVSKTFTGNGVSGMEGNRFRSTCLADLCIPLPKQYILGIDSQNKDLEHYGEPSYLRGEWKNGGWWYYYIYGLLIKVPCATWILLALIVLARQTTTSLTASVNDELILLVPAITLIVVASSQTAFNIHLRYVFPSLGMAMVFLGQAAVLVPRQLPFGILLTNSLVGLSVASTLVTYPHHLAYFNSFVGRHAGNRHILGSSFDWGQDLIDVAVWASNHPEYRRINLLCQTRYNAFDITPMASFPEAGADGKLLYIPHDGVLVFSESLLIGNSWPVAHPSGYHKLNASDLHDAVNHSGIRFERVGASTYAVVQSSRFAVKR